MTFALATAFFLSIAWLTIVALAATFEGRTSRIADALAGRTSQVIPPLTVRLTSRYAPRRGQRPVTQPRMRAAA